MTFSSPEILDLHISDLSRGGAGVGRDSNGRVIFVPFSAPGDRVRVQVTEASKNYAQGKLLKVLEPSALRQKPKCPVFGRCGGCEWQHLPYELQWKTKLGGALHALSRVGIQTPDRIQEIPARQIWEYRNRIQLRGFKKEMGFYASGSHEVIPIDRCEIARSEINEAWPTIRAEGENLPRPYKVEIETAPDGGAIRKRWNSKHAAGGFRQIHDEQNIELQRTVGSLLTPGRLLFDLFGGSGNLSLPLAGKMTEVHCVDLSTPREKPAGTPEHFHFHRAAVSTWIAEKAKEQAQTPPASAILDPPREGLAADFGAIANALAQLNVNEIVLVGCDPDAWARDTSRFVKKGWSVRSVAVLDLFPQTHHVESIALLVL